MFTRVVRLIGVTCCTLPFLLPQTGCLLRRELSVKGHLEYSARPDEVVAQRQSMAALMKNEPLTLQVADDPVSNEWTRLFSFIHVSDVQIRDYAIHYFDSKTLEKIVDKFGPSTVRDRELDEHDEYPWAALVGGLDHWLERNSCYTSTNTLNQSQEALTCVKRNPDCPQFLFHTGDAIDSNSEGELHRFLSIANRAPIPWFDVVGNHDIFLMGNFTESDIDIKNMQADGVAMVLNRDKFMRLHGLSDIGPTRPHLPTVHGCNGLPPSRFHGFDLFAQVSPDSIVGRYHPPLRAYYSIRYQITPQNNPGTDSGNVKMFRFVVLDTTSQHSMVRRAGSGEYPKYGAKGYIEPEQFAWLKRELADAALSGDIVLMFGHHPLLAPPDKGSKSEDLGNLLGTDPSGLRDTPIRELVARYPNIIAYFTGHTHLQRFAKIPDSEAWEITAPSLHEIPQSALLVTLLQNGSELGISIRSVRGHATGKGPISEGLLASCRGGARDKNVSQAECAAPTSQFLRISRGNVVDSVSVACRPISDPAPENKRIIPTGLTINLWQYAEEVNKQEMSPHQNHKELKLRGLLPLLSRLGPCLVFSFSPEIAELADSPIEVDESYDKELPLIDALHYLLKRLPEAKNGCGDLFEPILKQDEQTGELRILGKKTKAVCGSIIVPANAGK